MSDTDFYIQHIRQHYAHCTLALQDFEERLRKQEGRDDPISLWEQVRSRHFEEVLHYRQSIRV